MESSLPLPEPVTAALSRLAAAGAHAWVVGGALRDHALGREGRDFDLVVEEGIEAARCALPEAVFIDARTPILAIDDRKRRVRVEVSGLRAGASTLEEDLARRDFTLNAVAYDAAGARFIDPLGGRADLEARVLRAASPRAFVDDPVRILRGVRLCLELELTLETETRRAMERAHWRLVSSAAERRRDELRRLLELPAADAGLDELRRLGALAGVLPELLRLVAIGQNRHHCEDVYAHTRHVARLTAPDPLLRLAALLHDAAKPETKRWSARRDDFGFLRHEHRAAPHVTRAARRLRLSRREETTLLRLVRHHLLFADRLATPAAIRRMLRRVGRDILEPLIELRRADLRSRLEAGPAACRQWAEWEDAERRIRDAALADAQREPRLAVGGREVMQVLGIDAGPEVGRWLKRLERRVTEHPEENQRVRLLAWLRAAALEEEA